MKAAVCREFGKPLSVEELRIVEPGPGELRVEVKACGVCHSDITYMDGSWGGELPAVFGHEVAGRVDAGGEGVTELQVGQHLIVSLMRACGRCPQCVTGRPGLCEGSFRLDGIQVLTDARGESIKQGLRSGGFAQSVVVHASQAVPIPQDIPFEAACLIACAVLTGFGAVVNTAAVAPGQSVVVIGTGGVGLNAVQGAAIAGAYPVIAVDISAQKLELARSFGATHTVDARGGAEDAVGAATGGRLADVVVVAAGSGRAVEQGLRLAARGGSVVVVGMPGMDVTSQLPVTTFAYEGQRILGSRMGSAQPRVDVPRLIALYKAGRLKLDELVTGRYPLEQINDAIASAKRGDGIRNVVMVSE
ncbi:MAG TPA: Zn-dependent alcohol dehydrogenase [Candidatus Dormibacteraeota bacterium]|nr:Zn-dependent alcohol dehydrogenase [Candidatus Dormibacteraeota bacterium]